MNNLYDTVRTVALYATALAAVVSGFRIYQRWQRGEHVIPSILTWIVSIIVAVALVEMVDGWIFSGYIYGANLGAWSVQLAQEAHSASIVVGIVVAIVAVIRIYMKYNAGEDVTELIYYWVTSLFFLFSFGLIIEVLMS